MIKVHGWGKADRGGQSVVAAELDDRVSRVCDSARDDETAVAE